MFNFTVTSYINQLTSLKAILEKAKVMQENLKISDEALLNARLALDQFPLVRQVQIACDHAKKGSAVLCGVTAPVFEDNEKTLGELFERIDKTIAFLSTLSEENVVDLATAPMVPLYWAPGKGLMAKYFVETYARNNFSFHYTTAYSILRHYGLAIGKGDYMGGLELKDLA
jgi:hypothetical protein